MALPSGSAYTLAMKGLFGFAIFCAIVFFGVGETIGWNVGIITNTPNFFYKTTSTRSTLRRVISGESIDVGLEGNVSQGQVRLTVTYERPSSFQSPVSDVVSERIIFERTFEEGMEVFLTETLRAGQGIYRFRLHFEDATGRLRLTLPSSNDL